MGDITQHNTGKTLDKSRNTGNLHDYITTSNLYWGFFDFSELRKMPIESEELNGAGRVPELHISYSACNTVIAPALEPHEMIFPGSICHSAAWVMT
jgi:hypothetical protein